MSKHHKPRPDVVEKLRAKPAAPLVLNPADVVNCVVALRRGGLLALPGPEMAAVAASMDRLESLLGQHAAAQQAAAPAAPPATAPAATAEPAKA